MRTVGSALLARNSIEKARVPPGRRQGLLRPQQTKYNTARCPVNANTEITRDDHTHVEPPLRAAWARPRDAVRKCGLERTMGGPGCEILHPRPWRRHRTTQGGGLMKAAVVPAVNSAWQIQDVPQPQPGPGQVLVKMHASGICYTDVHETLGHIPGPFPRVLGHEPVGEIVAAAPDVSTRKVADRVGTAWIQSTCGRCEWCQRGRRMFCPYM